MNRFAISLILLLITLNLFSQNKRDTLLIINNYSEQIDIYSPKYLYINILSESQDIKPILDIENQKIKIELYFLQVLLICLKKSYNFVIYQLCK